MYLTIGEIKKNYPSAWIRSDARIESGAWIESDARIESGAWIERDAWIESGARIGSSAVIRSGARIGSVSSKFTGNISPTKEGMNMRIGCEIHSLEEWTKRGAAIARKVGESEWWESTGKAMLAYLVNEANVYLLKYGNSVESEP